jgi:type I restriction enzyme M protein
MKNSQENESIFLKTIKRGVEAGIIEFNQDESKIIYKCSRDYTTSFKNPEEKVRGSYFTELVLDYKYPKEKIDFEVIVPRRTPEDRADIVIYEDEELKKTYLVVETKKDGITDAEFKQAIEQAFGNANSLRAKYASVVAGTTKTAFDVAGFKASERAKNVIADIPEKYGKTPQYRFIKGEDDKELKIVSRDELIKALEKARDTVWQGGKLAPTTAFDEVAKLLFCKLKDEKITPKGKPYLFQIGTHESPEEVYKRINGIYLKAKKEDSEVFKEDIRLDPKIVYNVVEHLQTLAINKIDLDAKGVAFEKFMEDFFKGKMGQFFTPRPIVQFCIKMMNPERGNLVLDPACGSGGFLLNAMDNVRLFAEKNYDEREAWEHWHKFAENNLYGIEINDQIARVCKMNMIIHDDGHTNVISTDSLSNFEDINKIHQGFKKDHFDIILTNPPFGAIVKRTEKEYLDKYALGKDKQNQKTEVLFIERCIDFVKPKTGGIAIVLPDGILTNSSMQFVRDLIMERCQILAIVSIPQFAFSHYGAGVKSSLVFLRRKGDNEKLSGYPIFMAIAEHIGYDATGKDDPKNDLDQIFDEYHKFLKNPKNYDGC